MRAGNIVLVSECAAGSQRGKLINNHPFCTLRTCSGWLNGQLEVAGIPEERLYWIPMEFQFRYFYILNDFRQAISSVWVLNHIHSYRYYKRINR